MEKYNTVFGKGSKLGKEDIWYIEKTAENHPLIAKAIVIILTGILLGLAEDRIHDAIQMKNQVDMLESLTSIIDDGNKL